jgi:hypothetical protein
MAPTLEDVFTDVALVELVYPKLHGMTLKMLSRVCKSIDSNITALRKRDGKSWNKNILRVERIRSAQQLEWAFDNGCPMDQRLVHLFDTWDTCIQRGMMKHAYAFGLQSSDHYERLYQSACVADTALLYGELQKWDCESFESAANHWCFKRIIQGVFRYGHLDVFVWLDQKFKLGRTWFDEYVEAAKYGRVELVDYITTFDPEGMGGVKQGMLDAAKARNHNSVIKALESWNTTEVIEPVRSPEYTPSSPRRVIY